MNVGRRARVFFASRLAGGRRTQFFDVIGPTFAPWQDIGYRLTKSPAMKDHLLLLRLHLRIKPAILLTALAAAIAFVRAAETPPKPLFPDAAPVCPCESLAKVSLPNTTIDSAALDTSNGCCRVTATVTLTPSGDRVMSLIRF